MNTQYVSVIKITVMISVEIFIKANKSAIIKISLNAYICVCVCVPVSVSVSVSVYINAQT